MLVVARRTASTCPGVHAASAAKSTYCDAVWAHLEEHNLAAFPRPVHGRVPNFQGAHLACERCSELPEFQAAKVVQINPDKPQEYVRYKALEAGKTVLVPAPRFKKGLFNHLAPPQTANINFLRRCATSEGVRNYSKTLSLDADVKVDMVIVGSLAVSSKGHRIGKGDGFTDLLYAMMRFMGVVSDRTPIATAVHDCQVFDHLPDRLFEEHDVPVDYICTPTRIIKCHGGLRKPDGILWYKLNEDDVRRMPILKQLILMQQAMEEKEENFTQ